MTYGIAPLACLRQSTWLMARRIPRFFAGTGLWSSKHFLAKIDKEVPDEFEIHVICDNYGTHKHPSIKTWLAKHRRFQMQYTPTYSSWINQVERLFAEITRDLLHRSDHRSVQRIEADLRKWVKAWNEDPYPLVWTQTADDILECLGRLLKRTSGAVH